MGTYYEVPGGLAWCKANLHIIIGNESLDKIMEFGDLWRERGHKPLVHVTSPVHDNNKMWNQHEDISGLLTNIPAHIDMFIVDFYNRETPELPSMWSGQADFPYWQLWEYASGKVRFNGPTKAKFIEFFGVDPSAEPPVVTPPVVVPPVVTPPVVTPPGGTITLPSTIRVDLHVYHHGSE